jgi:hypothetical protein
MAPESLRSQSEIRTDYLPRPIWRSYIRFQGKKWIPKLKIISWHTNWTPNLHYLESGHGRYGAGNEGLRIRKIWTRLILWKPSLLLSQGISRGRQGGAHPKAPQGHKYNPLVTPRLLPIDIHSSESRRRSPQGGGRRGLAAAPPELEDSEDWSSSDASTTFNGTMLSILME